MNKQQQKRSGEHGGVALEYVIVSTFAAIAATTLLTFMASIAKEKISQLTKKLDVHVEEIHMNPFEFDDE